MPRKLWCLIVMCCMVLAGFSASHAQGGMAITTTDVLKMRQGPGRQFQEIVKIPAGTALTAFARDAQTAWLRVEYAGNPGWISAAYVTFQGDLNSLPIGEAAPIAPAGSSGAAPTAAPSSNQNGAILSMQLYAQTDRCDYYRIVYMSDGLRIAGFLGKPRDPGPHPAVIYNRGGNRGAGALQGYELAYFAEAGFVTVASQYRGGPGSGGRDQFGGGDVNDVLNLITVLRALPEVDQGRIAMFGTSRGAMMTYLALRRLTEQGRAGEIAVASTTSGLADLIAWGEQRPKVKDIYRQLIGATSGDALVARSAVYWAGLINSPLLIQHGDADSIVASEQSVRLAEAMRTAGKVVNLHIQLGAEHGLFAVTEGMPETLRWFNQYLARPGENFTYEVHQEGIQKAIGRLRTSW
jgi:acetyl esterase/lipase